MGRRPSLNFKVRNMSRKYETPPLVEAVCEFRFPQETEWDMTVPGRLYERVSGEFPVRKILILRPQIVDPAQMRFTGEERIAFWNEKNTALIQTGSRVMAINHLTAGYSWPLFSSMIIQAFKQLCQIANPPSVQQVTLHYVNRINIPEEPTQLEEWFNFRPYAGPGLPALPVTFLVGCEYKAPGEKDILQIELTSAPPNPAVKGKSYTLNLLYKSALDTRIELPAIPSLIESAHSQLETLFEGCITDRLRDLFHESNR